MSYKVFVTGKDEVLAALQGYVLRIGSQRRAAKRIGVDKKTLQNWLTGRYMIPEWFAGELGYRRVETRQIVQCINFLPLAPVTFTEKRA
jgi:hypothetical protein